MIITFNKDKLDKAILKALKKDKYKLTAKLKMISEVYQNYDKYFNYIDDFNQWNKAKEKNDLIQAKLRDILATI